MTFESLGLHESILEGVADAGYEAPTDIQKQAIPIAIEGRDLIALGQTGSGKTAAFGLPLLHRLVGGEPGLRGLILVPTRELCVQVAENLRGYAKHAGLKVCTAFGGINITIQESAFRRGVDVIVACPGRLIDHLQCGIISLENVETLILDEADRMLDMGFMPQIRKIFTRLPAQRQNCMFSATMPPEVERLVRDFFGGEVEKVQIGTRSQVAASITHNFEEMQVNDKLPFLERLLKNRQDGGGRVIMFVKTKTRAEEFGRKLKRIGLSADSIHGDKSAEARYGCLTGFDKGKIQFLVATDVAARGIDVSRIELVINVDMPMAVEDYVHRVGRTGRAGKKGEALSLITRMDKGVFRGVMSHIEKSSPDAKVVVDGRIVREGKDAREDREGARGGDERDRDDRDERDEHGSRDRGGRGRNNRNDRDRDERGHKDRDERGRDERASKGRERDERGRSDRDERVRDERGSKGRDDRDRDERGSKGRERDDRGRNGRDREERARTDRGRDRDRDRSRDDQQVDDRPRRGDRSDSRRDEQPRRSRDDREGSASDRNRDRTSDHSERSAKPKKPRVSRARSTEVSLAGRSKRTDSAADEAGFGFSVLDDSAPAKPRARAKSRRRD